MAKDTNKIFERMVDDMCTLSAGGQLLDDCMSLSPEAIRYVPLRCRIIALGFVRHYTLDELNEKLKQQGCPGLYTRNFWEASLAFAFRNGYSFDQWKDLQQKCAGIYAARDAAEWFQDKKITYGELERYVLGNSENQGDLLATEMYTRRLDQQLSAAGDSVDQLQSVLLENIHAFSTMREKTRYYFCKYMYYYLNRRIENYFAACRRNRGVDEALSDLLSLKVVTVLRRNKRMPEEEKRQKIYQSAISCGEIFDEFNYFYFGYVSVDWVEMLMECYQSVDEIPAAQKKSLAAVLRKGRPEMKLWSDARVIQTRLREMESAEDDAYALEGSRGYGKNRAGEHALHKYMQGTLDIDRTALICFLLFFASDASMPDAHRLTVPRLQAILSRCGYAALDIENDFDWFVAEFLESRRPREFLMDVMLGYARQSENSFLYHLYGNSVHYEDELLRVMVAKK